MAEVGSAFVSILPSAKGFGSKLDSQVGGELDSSGKKSGKRFGSALKFGALAAVGGAAVLAGFLKGSLDEAREAQKVGAQTNAVIKSTGGIAGVTANHVNALASAISAKSGIDDEAIASASNLLLTFTNVRNEVGKGNNVFDQATQIATDMGVALGTDASGSAIQLGKALNDPIKGISALSRVGVSFTEQQKAQIKTLVDSGRTLDAQKIILGELNKEFGGSAAAAATAGDKFKVAFGNLQESVGTALLPVFDKLLTVGANFAIALTNNIGPGIAALNGYLAPAIATVGRFFSALSSSGQASGLMATFSGLASSISANFLPVLRTAANTFQTVVLPAILRLGGYLQANLMPIFRQVANIVATQVVPIMASLARFLYGTLYPAIVRIVVQVATRLKPVFDQLFATIQNTVLPVIQRLLAKFREWGPTLGRVAVIVLKVVGFILVLAATILGRVLPVVIRFQAFMASRLVGALITVVGAIVRSIGFLIRLGVAFNQGANQIDHFVRAVLSGISKAVGFIGQLPGKAAAALGNLGGLLFNAGSELIQGLINGITAKLGALASTMSSVAGKIKGFLPGSPVKEGPLTAWNNGGAGKRLIDQGLIAGIDARKGDAAAAMSRLTSNIAAPRVASRVQLAHAGGGVGAAGAGPAVIKIYDVDGQLMGSMRGEVDADRSYHNTLTRQGIRQGGL